MLVLRFAGIAKAMPMQSVISGSIIAVNQHHIGHIAWGKAQRMYGGYSTLFIYCHLASQGDEMVKIGVVQ